MKRRLCMTLTLLLCLSSSGVMAAEKLNYRLKWLFNASVAGDIYADTQGYFAKEGLLVNVKEGGPEKNAIKELELGLADFGVASADQVIRAKDKGAKVVVIAQIFQINPMQWIYRDTIAPITTLSELKGHKIGYTFGGNDETIMKTLLAKGGVSEKDVNITGARFDFTPFLRGKVDIWPVYRNSQGVILTSRMADAGEGVRFFNPAEFGVNFVANSVVTSEKMLKNHPETVAKFQRALLAGWTEAMDPAHEDAVVQAINEKEKGNKPEITRLQLQATRDLVAPKGAVIGAIDKGAWMQTEAIMLEAKQIKKSVQVEKNLLLLQK